MKTAGGSTRRVAGHVDRLECAVGNCWEHWTREGTHVRKPGSGATRKTTRREDRRIVRQALLDATVTRSTIRADEHRQLRLQCCQSRSMWNVTGWQKVVFSDESRFVSGQMITVYGCAGALHVWDQLKQQMPSCHSVNDLELAVQDLWAHLPQDNIRCLINSMPDRLAACIAVGGGPTRY
ncbi:uncharacterized protein TNCV_3088761 [Trichonephila clavipes]|uniref:Transposase n=1 Tax=Trichonephila clavipes TaxID=2585209 RepID=A0A8X6RT47_TRICX|nr:uncharacterized protein TNCV_3088761 [Trichonephila clavipes]